MRVVAKVQFTTAGPDAAAAAQALSALRRWTERKFDQETDGRLVIRQSGHDAQLERRSDEFNGSHLHSMCILEPVEGGTLQTDVDVLAGPDRVSFRCILRVGSDAGVAPAEVHLRAPRFVREIVGLPFTWTVGSGGERVFAHPFGIDADDLPVLEELLVSPIRRLPIVMVSEHAGETLAGDLHERLGQDLCGLAHTVRVSTAASWALTGSRGKEWSCYNGAVRLFWPFRANLDDFRAHPLWTFDQLAARFSSQVEAREHLRNVLARRILEASTFVADDSAFEMFGVAKARAAADEIRATAGEAGDFEQLASLYASENDQLRAGADAQRAEIERLQQQVEALTLAMQSSPGKEAAAAAVEDAPPQTVMEAVVIARNEMADRLIIAPETDADIANLNAAAGPPDKILRYLRTLGDMADMLAQGSLGKSVPKWLEERKVACSVDSETTKMSKEGKRFRHRVINGIAIDCEFHAKPAEGVSPDMCARIYFATCQTQPHVRVGYIGRHVM